MLITYLTALKENRTWRDVATLIARCGGVQKSASWWMQVAAGEKTAHRADDNAVRRCFPGWPDLPPTAPELVDALGVLNAVVADPQPDTALLVQVGAAQVQKIVIQAGNLPPTSPPSCLVTAGNIAVARRKRASRPLIPYLSEMDVSGLETNRGQSGNLAAIAAAAARAAQALRGFA